MSFHGHLISQSHLSVFLFFKEARNNPSCVSELKMAICCTPQGRGMLYQSNSHSIVAGWPQKFPKVVPTWCQSDHQVKEKMGITSDVPNTWGNKLTTSHPKVMSMCTHFVHGPPASQWGLKSQKFQRQHSLKCWNWSKTKRFDRVTIRCLLALSNSWLPYSTYLYLYFHLLCSITKLKQRSRKIC